jgi:hypothetical protein
MKPVIGNQRLTNAPEDLEAQRAEVVCGQFGDQPFELGHGLAGLQSVRVPLVYHSKPWE